MNRLEAGWRKPYRKEAEAFSAAIENQRQKLISVLIALRAALDVLAIALAVWDVCLVIEGRGKLFLLVLAGIVASIFFASRTKRFAGKIQEGRDTGGEDIRLVECIVTKSWPRLRIARIEGEDICGFVSARADKDTKIVVTAILVNGNIHILGAV